LKLKAEARGYPNWDQTPENEDCLINDFYADEGIHLEKDVIRPNAVKRDLAKLCFNSTWDKLTEWNNRTKSKMISDPHELYRLLATPGVKL
jgi:hypothetical protein